LSLFCSYHFCTCSSVIDVLASKDDAAINA
jgi:hypothetical protein